jgi:hypothetical protein
LDDAQEGILAASKDSNDNEDVQDEIGKMVERG